MLLTTYKSHCHLPHGRNSHASCVFVPVLSFSAFPTFCCRRPAPLTLISNDFMFNERVSYIGWPITVTGLSSTDWNKHQI
ncbi:hypothetical protein FKM82_006150 [Ascaphus truei]